MTRTDNRRKKSSDSQLKGLDRAVAIVTQGSRLEDEDPGRKAKGRNKTSDRVRGNVSGGNSDSPTAGRANYSGWRNIFNPVFCYHGMIFVVIALTFLGIIMVFSSSSVSLVAAGLSAFRDAGKQIIFALIGLVIGLGIVGLSGWSVNLIRNLSLIILLFSWGLQLLTLTKLGVTINGNRGWLSIAGVQFQPAEIMKLALCLWMPLSVTLASRKAQNQEGSRKKALSYWIPVLTLAISFILVLAGKDLGTCLVIAAIGIVALYVGGFPLGWLFAGLLVAGGAVGYFAVFGSENRRARFLATYSGCLGGPSQLGCYQIVHGKYALASGGLMGVGLGASREKWNYLPEAKNDFIFAVIGEELGYVGAVLVILLFLILIWCMINIALRSTDPYAQTVILCVAGWIGFQTFINIGVVTSLLPVIGLPLPFISAGGSALIITLAAAGIVIGLSRRQPEIRATLKKQ